jgi:hypothetical protein
MARELRHNTMRGQAFTETMIMMSFMILMIFGFVHLCLLEATKSMVSLAAFSAARSVMVQGWRSPSLDLPIVGEFSAEFSDALKVQAGWPAAWQVLDNLRWWRQGNSNRPDFPIGVALRNNRRGLTITYHVPFGTPIFDGLSTNGLAVTAFSPYVIQHKPDDVSQDVSDVGDNAQQ